MCPIRPICLISLFFMLFVVKSSALEPATASITNLRDEAESYISQTELYRGAPFLLTNCIALAGPLSNSPRQDLSGLSLILNIGTTSSNTSYPAYMSNTNGTWWARFNVPTNWDAPKLQLKLTNSTDIFIYPWKILKTKAPL